MHFFLHFYWACTNKSRTERYELNNLQIIILAVLVTFGAILRSYMPIFTKETLALRLSSLRQAFYINRNSNVLEGSDGGVSGGTIGVLKENLTIFN